MLVCDVISCEWFCFRLDELIIMNVATEAVLLPARFGICYVTLPATNAVATCSNNISRAYLSGPRAALILALSIHCRSQ